MIGWRAVAAWCGSAALAAQSDWTLRGADARVHLVGPVTHWLQGPHDRAAGLPAGSYAVHFGADADGKPRSLQFDVPDGAVVSIATEPAATAPSEALVLGPSVEGLRFTATVDTTGYRVVATVTAGGEGAVGVLARGTGPEQFYRFLWDRAAREFRLERAFGGSARVMARAAAPPADTADHTLALQVEGFRLTACFDEAVVMQPLDGGGSSGAPGIWSELPSEAPADAVLQPAASARASAAIVVSDRDATLHAAVTVVPGHWHVLELALDRCHPPLPTTEGGLEPWLVLPPAAPVVVQADFRGSLGRGTIGEVGLHGDLTCEVRWPDFPVLRKQCLLARALLVSPRGEVVNGRTPAVRLLVP